MTGRVILLRSTSSWREFLPVSRTFDLLRTVTAELHQTELDALIQQLPANENEWPADIREDLETFVAATTEENGLIPKAACHTIFGVSRQRWDQMCKEYMFKTWTLFGKKWYSRKQLEEFYKVDRSALGGHHESKPANMAKMLKDCLSDASKD